MSGDNAEDYYWALRKLAICKHYRMAVGGGSVPSGGGCDLCDGEWDEGEAEKHSDDCLAKPDRM